ncbi:MAG TPA: response regulator [Verrucomicrobiae bacterium]|nr:response regulator [Verrucomicrobiae bacterium]
MRKQILHAKNINDVKVRLAVLKSAGSAGLANQIVVARDGAEALDYLYRHGGLAGPENGNPILGLLDMKLPKIGRLDVLKQNKSDPELRHLPEVVLTSSREERDLLEGYRLGGDVADVKPVEFPRFTQSVRQIGCFWPLVNEPPPAL